ncbi:Nuc1p like endonuclease G [Cryptosporidium felis]|nr:Nuc1p like endonuclease G [Cryptosporidium felis]
MSIKAKSVANLFLGVAVGTAFGYLVHPKIEGNDLRYSFIRNTDNRKRRIPNCDYFLRALNKYCFNNHVKSITGGFYPSSKLPSKENLILRESYLSSVSFKDKIPNWVAEKITENSCNGRAERANCIFQTDPKVPLIWSADNKDYFASGYSRGHMAAAGQHKESQTAQSDTFYLSGNILPQDLSNNGGDWYRLELISRNLTKYYKDVYVVSGPLFVPNYMRSNDFKKIAQNVENIERESPPKDSLGQICVIHKKEVIDKARQLGDEKNIDSKLIVRSDLKDTPVENVTYKVIGNKLVSAPTHLFKIILAVNPKKIQDNPIPPVAFSSFVMRNAPEEKRYPLEEYIVPLKSIEATSGLDFSGLEEFAIKHLKKNVSRKNYKKIMNQPDKELERVYAIQNLKDTLSRGPNAPSICLDEDNDRISSWRYLGYLNLSKTKQELENVWKTIKEKGHDKENIFLRKEYVNKCKSLNIEPEEF